MLLTRLISNSKIEYSVIDDQHGGYPLANIDVADIFTDSRQVVRNGLYIALEGLHTDSHKYLGESKAHGAIAAVVSENALYDGRIDIKSIGMPLIAVRDCRDAMARLYASWNRDPEAYMKFIAVTGTNGKTTVSRIIYEILARSGISCGIIGTTGDRMTFTRGGERISEVLDVRSHSSVANMTTPDPEELYRILGRMRESGVDHVVMEVTSHALAFKKVAPIRFDVGVFTNLSEDHLDLHGDMDEYYRVKKSLFDQCEQCVLNIDDRYGRKLSDEVNIKRFTVSFEGRASDFSACDIRSHGEGGMEYRLASGRMRLRIKTRLQGMLAVINTLEASAACCLLGIPPRDIKDSIAEIDGICGRLERLKLSPRVDFSVYIDYAHTPDALENLLRTVKMFAKRGQRIVLLFGCGGDREKQKRAMMGRIASAMADMFVITSDNPRSEDPSDIINDILSGVSNDGQYTVIEQRERAIEYVIKNARAGDIILLAGKGHEEYSIDKDGRHDFSEREIVHAAVKRYHG